MYIFELIKYIANSQLYDFKNGDIDLLFSIFRPYVYYKRKAFNTFYYAVFCESPEGFLLSRLPPSKPLLYISRL